VELNLNLKIEYFESYQNQNEGFSLVGKFPLRDLKLFFGKDENLKNSDFI